MFNKIKRIIKIIINLFGKDIIKIEKASFFDNLYCQYSRVNSNIINIKKLQKMSFTITAMITQQAGKILHTL